ncbi:MAG: acyl-CoA dehydrogenase family protein [Acidimicrobiia bacterium]
MTATEAPVNHDTPEEASFRADVRKFLEANAKPKTERGPWTVVMHTTHEEAQQEFTEGVEWQRTRFDAGMVSFTYPKEYGGQGGEPWMERIYNEEATRYGSSSGFISASIAMLAPTLMQFGTDEQKLALLPPLFRGDDTYCQLFSEPGAGSDLASLGSRAVLDGDEWVVNGQKVWNSSAQFCDKGFMLVRTNPDVPKHKGITMILVDMHAPGVEVRPLVQPTGASHFNEVFFEDVRVPVANTLGPVDGGWACARTVMLNESALIGGSAANKTFPNLHTIAKQQGLTDDAVTRQGLAEVYVREEVLGLLADRVMTAVRRREKPPLDPSAIKISVADNKAFFADFAAEMLGPAALVDDSDIQHWVINEVVGRYTVSIGGGTTEVQKNNLAERQLGLPKEPGPGKDTAWSDLPKS